MELYKIDERLNELLENVDEETGELLSDPEEFDELLAEKEKTLEGIALSIKNLTSDIAELKREEDNLSARRKAAAKKLERRTAFFQTYLAGEKFKTARVAVSYRNSKSVKVDEEAFWNNPDPRFIRIKPNEINKEELTKALKAGEIIPYASLEEKTSMVIK